MNTSLRVLVVEDNPGDARLVEVALAQSERPRFHVSFAATMAEARERLGSCVRTDVILLDLSLPDTSGEDTVSRMREAAPDLPIIIMTGLDDPRLAEWTVSTGAQDYLIKGDFTGPMLCRAITYAIARMNLMVERDTLIRDLRASVEMKNRMFGILAHDLRNPIGAVSGYAEFLEMTEEQSLSERMIASLAAIRESAGFMTNLIEEVMAMAVADAGDVRVNRQWLDIAAVARKAVAIGIVAAERKRVRLVVELQPAWIKGDAVKIEQVLNNLISNAVKFSKEGDVVTVKVAEGEGGVLLSVADLGAGIPEAVKVGLFKPFVKGRTGTAGERSNGLGLYICSRIVDAHGGRIEIATKEGQAHGTAFTVVIPGAAEPS